jgi:hypothetical protein
MRSILPKATRAALFGAGILLGGSVLDRATADVFLVQVSGIFKYAGESPPFIALRNSKNSLSEKRLNNSLIPPLRNYLF